MIDSWWKEKCCFWYLLCCLTAKRKNAEGYQFKNHNISVKLGISLDPFYWHLKAGASKKNEEKEENFFNQHFYVVGHWIRWLQALVTSQQPHSSRICIYGNSLKFKEFHSAKSAQIAGSEHISFYPYYTSLSSLPFSVSSSPATTL